MIEPSDTDSGLKRGLRSRHVTMISLGGIIGAGLFVGSSAAIAAVGPAVIVSYLLAGLVMLLVMRMPRGDGDSVSGRRIVHRVCAARPRSLGRFLSGWLYWYFWVVVIAIEAIAGAKLLHAWIALPPWQIGLVLLVALTAVNLASSRAFGEFEFWFASIKVAAIVAFILIGAAYVFGLVPGGGAQEFGNLTAHHGFAPFGGITVLSGVVTVFFALCGAEIATIAAAESNASASVISQLTFTLVVRVVLFYVLSMLLIVLIVPWDQIVPGVSPFVVALERMRVSGRRTLMSFVVLTAVLSCLNSGLYITSRVLFTLSRHRDAPQPDGRAQRASRTGAAILIGTSFGFSP